MELPFVFVLNSEPFATKPPATHSRFSADQPLGPYWLYRLLWLGVFPPTIPVDKSNSGQKETSAKILLRGPQD